MTSDRPFAYPKSFRNFAIRESSPVIAQIQNLFPTRRESKVLQSVFLDEQAHPPRSGTLQDGNFHDRAVKSCCESFSGLLP